MTSTETSPTRSEHPDTGPVIVVGVDGSAIGDRALRWAMREAARQHGSVAAVSVRHRPELAPATSLAILPHGQRSPAASEAAHLAKLRAEVAAARIDTPWNVPVTTTAITGDPAQELANLSTGADLLVVGGHRHGPLVEAFLGSVAADVLRRAHCPVVVIPPGMRDDAERPGTAP